MFKGFQTAGPGMTATTTRPKNLFAGFPNTSFGNLNGLQGNIPSDNLVAWFNPQIIDPTYGITLNGNTVSSWKDTSGTYNLVQATAANQPTYVQSSLTYKNRNYLTFDTTDFLLLNPSQLGIGANPAYTILSLYFFSSPATAFQYAMYYGGGSFTTAGEYGLRTTAGAVRQVIYFDSSLKSVGTTIDTAQLSLKGFEINRTNGLMYFHQSNQFRIGSTSIVTTLTDYNGGPFRMGGVLTGTMTMFDTLIYNRALTQAEYSSIYNYFNGLYGYV
jgi:hypothetical protein